MCIRDSDDGEITVHAWKNGQDLFIDVRDNGLGMPPEVLERLLDERQPLTRSKGSGIGVRDVYKRQNPIWPGAQKKFLRHWVSP